MIDFVTLKSAVAWISLLFFLIAQLSFFLPQIVPSINWLHAYDMF